MGKGSDTVRDVAVKGFIAVQTVDGTLSDVDREVPLSSRQMKGTRSVVFCIAKRYRATEVALLSRLQM
jgi:hypothetical protein